MRKTSILILSVVTILLLNGCGETTSTPSGVTDYSDYNYEEDYEEDYVYDEPSSSSTDTTKWNIEGDAESALAVEALNKIRTSVGLTTLKTNLLLEQSAQNHANYVWDVWMNFRVNVIHYEYEDEYPSEYYSGQLKERIAKVYSENDTQMLSSTYSENITLELNLYATYDDSLDELMTAIYHRFGFLDTSIIEVGIGHSGGTWNYNMSSNSSAILNNPSIVKYPFDGQLNTRRFFRNNESPDPLYGKDIVGNTGNPISIEFTRESTVTVSSFKLYKLIDDEKIEVTNTFMLNHSNDPHNKFGGNQFALFPLDVLDGNTTYSVEVIYDGGIENWEFVTL